MSSMINENDWLNAITRETFELTNLTPSIKSLVTPFKWVEQYGLIHYFAQYDLNIQAFNFLINGQKISFPRNWSFFEGLYSCYSGTQKEQSGFVKLISKLDKNSDPDFLLDILSVFLKRNLLGACFYFNPKHCQSKTLLVVFTREEEKLMNQFSQAFNCV